MSTIKFLLALMLSRALLLAQLTNNTVTATASQSSTTAPDQAILSIIVSSGASATLEQIVNALSGVGVTTANLNNAFGITNVNVQWSFQLIVPLAQLETTTAALTSLQKSISQNNSGLSLSFNVSGTQFSGQAPSNCNFTTLLAQARTQAQQIAGAAGLQTGAVTALSGATTTCSLTVTFAIPTLLAQPGPNTITITATGTTTPQNDQATIYLNVGSPSTADLADVTNALTANGITGANLSGLYSSATTLNWSFTLTVPLSKLTATLAQVISAEQSVSKQSAGLGLILTNVDGSASQSQQTSACSQSTLVSSAHTFAQQIAAAAGVSVGPVLNISQGGSTGTVASVISGLAELVLPIAIPCTLTVQYQLL